ncbi:hypothetical protein ACIOKD_14325 [Streptomyces sp. NPDC087844]|uniref:hypothetical protein n=1 Tax=Streptomyces sp. NPDC087844 TaxID=3365805 RepID=UPI00382B4CA5
MDTDPTTQQQYVRLAWNAVSKAADLAGQAENAAREGDRQKQVAPLATAGALWADVARTYSAIAAILPEPTDQDTEDTHA